MCDKDEEEEGALLVTSNGEYCANDDGNGDCGQKTSVAANSCDTLVTTQGFVGSKDATRWRLSLCIFLYTIGSSVMTQILPKVVLEHYRGNDSRASRFHGWLTASVSVLQFFLLPAVAGMSDRVGRRVVIGGALLLHSMGMFAFAVSHDSLVTVVICHAVAGLATVITPVSQAIMIDVSEEDSGVIGNTASHGLGLTFGAVGFAMCVGDILGGSLSENKKTLACAICGGFMLLAVLSLRFLGWKETAPGLRRRRQQQRDSGIGNDDDRNGCDRVDEEEGNGCGSGIVFDGGEETRRRRWMGNAGLRPFDRVSILKVLLGSSMQVRVAFCYFCFVVSLNVFAMGYNYVHYRFDWTPLEISFFFAAFNAFMGLASGLGTRFLVPHRLTEENGGLFGTSLQACAGAAYGACFKGWMLYPALAFGALQNMTEPCLQAIMAKFVSEDRQGSLQGAVMSLRVVAEGSAAVIFVQVFAVGTSIGFPQVPFFLAAGISLVGLAAAWSPLRKLNKARFEVETAATHPPDSLVPAGDKSNAEEDDNFDEFTVDIANSDWTGGQGSPTSAPLSEAISFDGTKRTLDNGGQHLSSNDGNAASTPAAGGGSRHVERETSETAETAAQMFDGESGAADELRQPLLSSASSA